MSLEVLLVSDAPDGSQVLLEGLRALDAKRVEVISVTDNVLKALTTTPADLIVLDVAKPSASLLEQCAVVHEYCPKPVVCFSAVHDSHLIARSVKAGISAFIVDGKTSSRVQSIIEVAMARFKLCQSMKKELLQVKDKLAERAVIERAKGLLIEHKNMSEDQAYKTLRKMAMDQGKKISVVAHEVCDVVAALSA
ncbi:ANTAR domain-containing protein [Thiomicrorhabdus cannonii]|uniref:ANTAR domain-containing protein n=1 Tax=Thiomicrorhabdus cannonii TaxID=2748011 RepID=UPI0015C13DE8